MNTQKDLNIKIGDMIKSNTGACGIVIELPKNDSSEYIINWNRGDKKEWSVQLENMECMIKYGKWEIISS